MTEGQQVGGIRSFLPAVEGMRACAAMGVVVTHVAFQTGHSSGVAGRLFGRFDLAVAVFFALSGFLLWRGHAAAARDLGSRPRTGHYLRSRVIRIMPAYVVAVVVILTLLPDADQASLTVWLANLTLTQIYVPLTLTGGLTQMWSLSVEVTFYVALPVLALLARRLPVRARVCAIAALAALSLAWGWAPMGWWHSGPGINPLNWPPAFFSWFAAGMLLAEWAYSGIGLPVRLAQKKAGRVLMAVIAVSAYLVAASPLAGPEGLIPGTATQFAVKTAMGSLVAFALVAPLVLDRPDATPGAGQHRHGDFGALVVRHVRVALGRPGAGIPGARDVPVHRPDADGVGVDAALRLGDRRGQLRAGRVAVPGSAAPVGTPAPAGRGTRRKPSHRC